MSNWGPKGLSLTLALGASVLLVATTLSVPVTNRITVFTVTDDTVQAEFGLWGAYYRNLRSGSYETTSPALGYTLHTQWLSLLSNDDARSVNAAVQTLSRGVVLAPLSAALGTITAVMGVLAMGLASPVLGMVAFVRLVLAGLLGCVAFLLILTLGLFVRSRLLPASNGAYAVHLGNGASLSLGASILWMLAIALTLFSNCAGAAGAASKSSDDSSSVFQKASECTAATPFTDLPVRQPRRAKYASSY
ncbi:uncharacterized protein EHS24_003228 [Apiotrichum porosum]|uniref:Uncharacterized protein n=1 Tax=Apiotrichum porosum TaxID=105984 RepID=A0A427XFS3_9TREE|nr:uncharacterized protein EHS24_003228 [Apiotrichum porosum]RSH77666.1 hypothetical protein EHS24_003228 [Apiotrichum porosum]